MGRALDLWNAEHIGDVGSNSEVWSKANGDYFKIHFVILNFGQHNENGHCLSHSTDQGHNMMTLPLAKSMTTPMPTHTLLNIRLTLARKPLTVMRIDGGVKSIGSPAQELLSVPSLLVWKRSAGL